MKKIISSFIISSVFFLAHAQTFTVKQEATGQNNLTDIRGQSFIPSMQGDGTGDVGDKDTVYLNSFAVVYSYSSVSEADTLYVYSQMPDSIKHLDDGSQGMLIGKSISKTTDGIYTVYSFENLIVNKNNVYYVLFREDVNLEASSGSSYDGGSALRNRADTLNYNDYLDLRFTATCSRIISHETNITDFYVDGLIGDCVIDTTNHTVTAEVEKSTAWNNLYTKITLSPGAGYLPGTHYFNYTNGAVTITVTAEDGITAQEWKVTLSKEANDQTDITYFSVGGLIGSSIIDKVNHTVTAEVDKSTNWENLYTGITLSYGATYRPERTFFNYAEDMVTITVKAEDDATSQDWKIIISKEPNNQTDIKDFYFQKQVGYTVIDTSNSKIYIKVNKGTELSSLIPHCEMPYGAKINPETEVSTDFSSGKKVYSILAEDSINSEDWTVHVSTDDNSLMADPNLVAYYTFESQVLIDESGNGHHGQVNGPTFQTDNGIRGGCFAFDSGYGNVELFNYQPSGSASFNIWVKPSDSENAHRIFHKGKQGGSGSKMWSYSLLYYQNYFRFNIANSSGTNAALIYSDSTSVPGKWYMVTCTFDDETNLIKLYVDGQLMGQDTSDNEIPITPEPIKISDYPNPSGELQWIDGYVDEFSIWGKELSTDEIGYLYNNKALPMSANAEIKSFTLPEQTNSAIIDSLNQHIEITVARGTDISALEPTITVSPGATIYPFSDTPVDFSSSPVTYTVTAEDLETSKQWTVTVLVEKSSSTEAITGNDSFSLYPNPSKGLLTVEFNDNKTTSEYQINILNLDSRCVYKEAGIFGKAKTLDLSSLCQGMYIVQIVSGQEIVFMKKILLSD